MTKNALIDVTEQKRLNDAREAGIPWKKWGPYLSERQWGTVREDYSDDGNAWDYFSHDQARSRAYRWGEDGLGGHLRRQAAAVLRARAVERARPDPEGAAVRPDQQRGQPRRGREGVLLLRRQHADALVHEVPLQVPAAGVPVPRPRWRPTARRSREEFEYELLDTGVFDDDRYFDVFVEYAKAGPEDVLVRITVHNRGPEAARLRVLPTLWFRNTWSWGGDEPKPSLRAGGAGRRSRRRTTSSATTGCRCDGEPELLFTENETQRRSASGASRTPSPYVKDAFHAYVVAGQRDAVNPARVGTKAAAHYALDVPAGGSRTVRLRLVGARAPAEPVRRLRRRRSSSRLDEADEFYAADHAAVARARTSGGCTARRWPACCGASSSTTSTSSGG